ncbi:hypothetical protein MMC14_005253 [Varicellaria rhodocarpa]|nr:hypothetical protein [Varicellaria rhodocarpa]
MSEARSQHRAIVLKLVEGKPGKVWYPLHLINIPTPKPSSVQLFLRPTHLSLNHLDLFLRQHLYPSPSFTTPLFSDACCIVVGPPRVTPSTTPTGTSPSLDAPPPVDSSLPTGTPPQRRVLLAPGHGWISDPVGPENKYSILGGTSTNPLGVGQEFITVDEEDVVECPAHLSGAEAAALPLTGTTAWRALVTKSGAATPGSNILITGIGGGVALMALLFAVSMGVNVYATSSSDEKISRAIALGAKGGVNYKEEAWEKKLGAMVQESTPERGWIDAVIDGAGGDIVPKAGRILKNGGIIVSYGMTLSPTLHVPMSIVLKNIEVRGSTMGSRKDFRDMVAFVADRRIRPVVSKVVTGAWDDDDEEEEGGCLMRGVEELFADMKAGRQFGKLVLGLEMEMEMKMGKEGGRESGSVGGKCRL